MEMFEGANERAREGSEDRKTVREGGGPIVYLNDFSRSGVSGACWSSELRGEVR